MEDWLKCQISPLVKYCQNQKTHVAVSKPESSSDSKTVVLWNKIVNGHS